MSAPCDRSASACPTPVYADDEAEVTRAARRNPDQRVLEDHRLGGGKAKHAARLEEHLFHFDCPQEVYQADACASLLLHSRLARQLRKFFKRRGVHRLRPVQNSGVGEGGRRADCRLGPRFFVIGMVRTSVRLHRPGRLLLFAHNDCGAYPGSAPGVIAADVNKAAAILRDAFHRSPASRTSATSMGSTRSGRSAPRAT